MAVGSHYSKPPRLKPNDGFYRNQNIGLWERAFLETKNLVRLIRIIEPVVPGISTGNLGGD